MIVEKNIKLVIVDSVLAHFRSEYTARSELAPRQQLINNFLHRLHRIGRSNDIVLVVTNQVISKPDLYGGIIPAGGNIIGHASATRLFIRRGGDSASARMKNVRIATLIKSPWLPNAQAPFQVCENGIRDIDKAKSKEVDDEEDDE